MSLEAMSTCWGDDFPDQAEGIRPAVIRVVALAVADVVNDLYDNQFFGRRKSLAVKVGLSPDTVGDVLKHLVSVGVMIVVRSDPGEPVVYQWLRGVRSTTAPPTSNQRTGYVEPTHQNPNTDTSNPASSFAPSAKKRRSGRVIELREDERPGDFARFWEVYPRKLEKLDAMKAWRDYLDVIPPIGELIAAAEAVEARVSRLHPTTPEWRKFIPYPGKWIRRGGWEDERPAPVATPAEIARDCRVCGLSPIGDASACLIAVKGLGDLDACPWRKP